MDYFTLLFHSFTQPVPFSFFVSHLDQVDRGLLWPTGIHTAAGPAVAAGVAFFLISVKLQSHPY
jgi:hypothetical protein